MTGTEARTADAHARPQHVELTMLNVMGGTDFEASVARHREWGLRWMDLKGAIYGKDLKDLSLDDAVRAARLLEENGLEVYCFSTVLLGGDVTAGEEQFAARDLLDLDHILRLAEVLQPRFVRLLGAQMPGHDAHENAIARVEREFPWVIETYRAAIDRIVSAGFAATVENEGWSCMLSSPEDFLRFFSALDRPGGVSLTWDAQNQWATGVMPTVAVYEELRELIGYYHVKGGKTEGRDGSLAWNVALDEATWPVVEVTQRIVDDGSSPVICLNPPGHGKAVDGYQYGDAVTERDLAFLRRRVRGVR
jgi:sugar phosphate isomerase/epimerase